MYCRDSAVAEDAPLFMLYPLVIIAPNRSKPWLHFPHTRIATDQTKLGIGTYREPNSLIFLLTDRYFFDLTAFTRTNFVLLSMIAAFPKIRFSLMW